jgi:hypothetical protein
MQKGNTETKKEKKAIVRLHKDCLDFGGADVYPHNCKVVLGSKNFHERLIYCKLGGPFFGRDKPEGRLIRRTDTSHGMWIPEWLLFPVLG